MPKPRLQCLIFFLMLAITTHSKSEISARQQLSALDEIIVTAQKREQSLQEIPVAVSVLTFEQLEMQGITSLGDLRSGTITSLNIQPYANAPSALVIAIRGNGPGDVGHSTRDAGVAVYFDEIYMGRAQGLDMDLAELERIEILRGPQGTLFGRNATAGAISLVSKRPTGKWGIKQTISTGNYNLKTSATHLNLPELGGIKSKLDFFYSDRSGWVDNTDPDESDYNALTKKGARFSADWVLNNDLVVQYNFHKMDTDAGQNYYQFYNDFIGIYGNERKRMSKTRQPVSTLDPTITVQNQHSLKLSWELSDSLSFQSISSYRDIDDRARNNFYGVLYFNGLIEEVDIEQEQVSQEFRLTGELNRVEYVAGVYYYKERVDEYIQQLFSLDIFGYYGQENAPIDPPTTLDVLATNTHLDPINVRSKLKSSAVYTQATWTPPVLNDQMEITLGLRYTDERRTGASVQGDFASFSINENHVDPAVTFHYNWTDNVSAYTKWSRAFRSGGVNIRSSDLIPFGKEQVAAFETGLKLQTSDRRLRMNATYFETNFDGMFIDLFNPSNPAEADTVNAKSKVTVDGVELELTFLPIKGLTLALNYTYLDGEMPLQPNTLSDENILESFQLTQTPRHAGSVSIDYVFMPTTFGTPKVHIDLLSTAPYHHFPSGGVGHPDGYILLNARLELANVPALDLNGGNLLISLWAKNITDEQYVISSFHLEGASTIHAFGEPRMAGFDITYHY